MSRTRTACSSCEHVLEDGNAWSLHDGWADPVLCVVRDAWAAADGMATLPCAPRDRNLRERLGFVVIAWTPDGAYELHPRAGRAPHELVRLADVARFLPSSFVGAAGTAGSAARIVLPPKVQDGDVSTVDDTYGRVTFADVPFFARLHATWDFVEEVLPQDRTAWFAAGPCSLLQVTGSKFRRAATTTSLGHVQRRMPDGIVVHSGWVYEYGGGLSYLVPFYAEHPATGVVRVFVLHTLNRLVSLGAICGASAVGRAAGSTLVAATAQHCLDTTADALRAILGDGDSAAEASDPDVRLRASGPLVRLDVAALRSSFLSPDVLRVAGTTTTLRAARGLTQPLSCNVVVVDHSIAGDRTFPLQPATAIIVAVPYDEHFALSNDVAFLEYPSPSPDIRTLALTTDALAWAPDCPAPMWTCGGGVNRSGDSAVRSRFVHRVRAWAGAGHGFLRDATAPGRPFLHTFGVRIARYDPRKTTNTFGSIFAALPSAPGAATTLAYFADTCQGDSGGPLWVEVGGQAGRVLLGVTSHGYNCGMMPGAMTSVAPFVAALLELVPSMQTHVISLDALRPTGTAASAPAFGVEVEGSAVVSGGPFRGTMRVAEAAASALSSSVASLDVYLPLVLDEVVSDVHPHLVIRREDEGQGTHLVITRASGLSSAWPWPSAAEWATVQGSVAGVGPTWCVTVARSADGSPCWTAPVRMIDTTWQVEVNLVTRRIAGAEVTVGWTPTPSLLPSECAWSKGTVLSPTDLTVLHSSSTRETFAGTTWASTASGALLPRAAAASATGLVRDDHLDMRVRTMLAFGRRNEHGCWWWTGRATLVSPEVTLGTDGPRCSAASYRWDMNADLTYGGFLGTNVALALRAVVPSMYVDPPSAAPPPPPPPPPAPPLHAALLYDQHLGDLFARVPAGEHVAVDVTLQGAAVVTAATHVTRAVLDSTHVRWTVDRPTAHDEWVHLGVVDLRARDTFAIAGASVSGPMGTSAVTTIYVCTSARAQELLLDAREGTLGPFRGEATSCTELCVVGCEGTWSTPREVAQSAVGRSILLQPREGTVLSLATTLFQGTLTHASVVRALVRTATGWSLLRVHVLTDSTWSTVPRAVLDTTTGLLCVRAGAPADRMLRLRWRDASTVLEPAWVGGGSGGVKVVDDGAWWVVTVPSAGVWFEAGVVRPGGSGLAGPELDGGGMVEVLTSTSWWEERGNLAPLSRVQGTSSPRTQLWPCGSTTSFAGDTTTLPVRARRTDRMNAVRSERVWTRRATSAIIALDARGFAQDMQPVVVFPVHVLADRDSGVLLLDAAEDAWCPMLSRYVFLPGLLPRASGDSSTGADPDAILHAGHVVQARSRWTTWAEGWMAYVRWTADAEHAGTTHPLLASPEDLDSDLPIGRQRTSSFRGCLVLGILRDPSVVSSLTDAIVLDPWRDASPRDHCPLTTITTGTAMAAVAHLYDEDHLSAIVARGVPSGTTSVHVLHVVDSVRDALRVVHDPPSPPNPTALAVGVVDASAPSVPLCLGPALSFFRGVGVVAAVDASSRVLAVAPVSVREGQTYPLHSAEVVTGTLVVGAPVVAVIGDEDIVHVNPPSTTVAVPPPDRPVRLITAAGDVTRRIGTTGGLPSLLHAHCVFPEGDHRLTIVSAPDTGSSMFQVLGDGAGDLPPLDGARRSVVAALEWTTPVVLTRRPDGTTVQCPTLPAVRCGVADRPLDASANHTLGTSVGARIMLTPPPGSFLHVVTVESESDPSALVLHTDLVTRRPWTDARVVRLNGNVFVLDVGGLGIGAEFEVDKVVRARSLVGSTWVQTLPYDLDVGTVQSYVDPHLHGFLVTLDGRPLRSRLNAHVIADGARDVRPVLTLVGGADRGRVWQTDGSPAVSLTDAREDGLAMSLRWALGKVASGAVYLTDLEWDLERRVQDVCGLSWYDDRDMIVYRLVRAPSIPVPRVADVLAHAPVPTHPRLVWVTASGAAVRHVWGVDTWSVDLGQVGPMGTLPGALPPVGTQREMLVLVDQTSATPRAIRTTTVLTVPTPAFPTSTDPAVLLLLPR